MSVRSAEPSTTLKRLIVGPFNRVEGDLEVRIDIADGHVKEAWVTAPMYRGFEQMLYGRPVQDALVMVPRICGICSVSQSLAASQAIANLQGIVPTPNGQRITNVMMAVENLADHLTHFYLFFMPDFCREVYRQKDWYAEVLKRFQPLQGEQARRALAVRQRWFQILGMLGGKWPHTQSIQAGGVSRGLEASERIQLLGLVREFRGFLQDQLIGSRLESFVNLETKQQFETWQANLSKQSDFALFLTIAQDLQLKALGQGPRRYLSYGAYRQSESKETLFASGVWDGKAQSYQALNSQSIVEDSCHAWYDDSLQSRHPYQGQTVPDAEKAQAYTWNKAPRLDGLVVETGALARQLVNQNALIQSLESETGGSVYTRIVARIVELATVVLELEKWLLAVEMKAPFCTEFKIDGGQYRGEGLTEAARGALGHWLSVEQGKICHYQIIAPTSWNFSPRDTQGIPGALEMALVGAPVFPGEQSPVSVQHIVRSFDPCMVCTVH